MPKVWRLPVDIEGETPQLVNSELAQLLALDPEKLKEVEAILKSNSKFSDMPSITESEE